MSIKSNAFGRVVLTDQDADKFRAQVTYGRPKAAAIKNVASGVTLSQTLRAKGAVSVRLKTA